MNSINAKIDIILLTAAATCASGIEEKDRPMSSALCTILYICKYTYFNRPTVTDKKQDSNTRLFKNANTVLIKKQTEAEECKNIL